MNAFLNLLARDLRLALRQRGDMATVVFFFALVATLFPFALGSDSQKLAGLAPGILWVTALLAVLLSLDRVFANDHEDGSLDLLALGPLPLGFVVLAKVAAHWLTTGLPLILATPLVSLLYSLPGDGLAILLFALLLGTPSLSLIGALGAALTLGARRGGVLVALLVLPLYIPVLIFGVLAVDAALAESSPTAHLALLGALFLFSLVLVPLAAGAALRQALE